VQGNSTHPRGFLQNLNGSFVRPAASPLDGNAPYKKTAAYKGSFFAKQMLTALVIYENY